MGTHCSLYIFPPGRAPREYPLGRWHYFMPVYDALGVFGGPEDRVSAGTLLATLSQMTQPEILHSTLAEMAAACREEAIAYLRTAIHRWGADAPTMILPEEFTATDFTPPLIRARMDRRNRWRENMARKARDEQAERDVSALQQWRADRHRHQYGDSNSCHSLTPR